MSSQERLIGGQQILKLDSGNTLGYKRGTDVQQIKANAGAANMEPDPASFNEEFGRYTEGVEGFVGKVG